jgi:hypothetical protein
MTTVSLNDFGREAECLYDGERYFVRDNGSVLCQHREGKRARKDDANWTFGKPDSKNGYIYISTVRIHRIVATAFHGDPPTPQHVVDHIDTNRRNNRPENLRWLTRLENALQNPITVKRIEFYCGSIEAFLEDPSKLRQSSLTHSFDWMRTVTPEEAKACRERMNLWAKSDKPSSGGSLGEWVFKPIPANSQAPRPENTDTVTTRAPREARPSWQKSGASPYRASIIRHEEPDTIPAKTSGAAQRKWRTPTEFPCCPQETGKEALVTYAENLKTGAIFSQNHLWTSLVLGAALTADGQSIWVLTEQRDENAIKPWGVTQVTYEGGLYVHTSNGTCFEKIGAEKRFCLARGLEWTGADSIDDYC